MRRHVALWVIDVLVALFLIWIKAPESYWFVAIGAMVVIEWIADRWIFKTKRIKPAQLFANRRMVRGLIGAVLGAAVGIGIGLFMQSDATTLKWLAILLGTLGLVFGLAFKLTL
jgi:hypothetical protein